MSRSALIVLSALARRIALSFGKAFSIGLKSTEHDGRTKSVAPERRSAPVSDVVFQRPRGTPVRQRWPRGGRPSKRAIFVECPVSSMKISFDGSHPISQSRTAPPLAAPASLPLKPSWPEVADRHSVLSLSSISIKGDVGSASPAPVTSHSIHQSIDMLEIRTSRMLLFASKLLRVLNGGPALNFEEDDCPPELRGWKLFSGV